MMMDSTKIMKLILIRSNVVTITLKTAFVRLSLPHERTRRQKQFCINKAEALTKNYFGKHVYND